MKFLLYVSKSTNKLDDNLTNQILTDFDDNENYSSKLEFDEHHSIFQQFKKNYTPDPSIVLENEINLSESNIYNKEKISSIYSLSRHLSDEGILNHLHKLGPKRFKEIDGAFAYVSYNKVTKKIFIAKDIFGHIPLYYYCSDKEMIVSNCLKSINTIRATKKVCSLTYLFTIKLHVW